MKIKILLLLGGLAISFGLTGCIIVHGHHHTDVIAPVPPPPVIVEPAR